MGSLRNPVGPLPSTIYWRRRAVAAVLVALIAVLVAWAVTSGGGGRNNGDGKPGGSDPVESITPGPSGSGPAISQQPGGRSDSGGSGDSGDADGSGDGTSGGSGSGSGSGGGSGDGGSDNAGSSGGTGADGTSGASGAGSSGSASGQQVPAGSTLPDCAPAAVQLTLRTKVTYGPDDRPKFELVVKNTSSTQCKADVGPKTAVLTVTEAGADDDVIWSSADCPSGPGSLYLAVPAGSTVVHTVDWNRAKSAPKCATPPAGKAGPGTYLLEAESPGEPLQRASFVLAKD